MIVFYSIPPKAELIPAVNAHPPKIAAFEPGTVRPIAHSVALPRKYEADAATSALAAPLQVHPLFQNKYIVMTYPPIKSNVHEELIAKFYGQSNHNTTQEILYLPNYNRFSF